MTFPFPTFDPVVAAAGGNTVSGHSTLPTNLLSYWRLEEASGSRVDEVGGLTLTDNNTVLQGTGKQGNCGDFEKTNSERLETTSHHVTTIGTGSFSVSAWVNPESISAANGTFGQGITASLNSDNDGSFQISVSSTGAVMCSHWSTVDVRFVTDTTPLSTLTTWYHIVVTYNGTVYKLYVDNVEIASTDDSAQSAGWGSGTFIGVQWSTGTSSYAWDGLIDEVGMWDKALSASEISDLYNSGSGIPYS